MEDTAAQAYSWFQMGAVALVSLAALAGFLLQIRPRPYNPVALALRAIVAVGVFAVVFMLGGVGLNWLWAGVFAVVGAGLGFLAGKTSRIEARDAERAVIRKAPWAALATALSYIVAAAALAYGTAGLFSVSLLFVLFSAMMTVGATAAEISQGAPSAPARDAADAST